MGNVVWVLWQILYAFQQFRNFENLLRFDKVIVKVLHHPFSRHSVYMCISLNAKYVWYVGEMYVRGGMLDFAPSTDLPGLQYVEHVDAGSAASDAGLMPGDFILEVLLVPVHHLVVLQDSDCSCNTVLKWTHSA